VSEVSFEHPHQAATILPQAAYQQHNGFFDKGWLH
jgi:hypothetical protein